MLLWGRMLLAPLLEALEMLWQWAQAALAWLLQLLWPSTVTLDGGRRCGCVSVDLK